MTLQPLLAFGLPGITGLGLWLWAPSYRKARAAALTVSLVLIVIAVQMIEATAGGEVFVHAMGNWKPPFGIVFAVDRLSALFVLLQSLVLFVTIALLRAETHGESTAIRAYPILFMLSEGLMGAFMTGDLFNLFVMFELVLLASYMLLQVPGTRRSLRAGFANISINLIASALFFAGVGILYGACGSVNMADLSMRIGDAHEGLKIAGLTMLVVAFTIKAGILPIVFWLPSTYPTLTGPVAALFAGMMTKLGVYALMRTAPLLMQGTILPEVLVWAGAASALLGVLAALAQYEIRRLLGFHIVSQVGYMILGLGLLTVTGLAGAIFYLSHHILVKATLYFVGDELERRNGTRDLREMDFTRAKGWAIKFIFVTAAFSLAGLPPFSGFFAKIGLFKATYTSSDWFSLSVLVVASFYTLASMLKIWRLSFQEKKAEGEPAAAPEYSVARMWPMGVLVAASLLLAINAGKVYGFAEDAARQLLDTKAYAARVLSVQGYPVPVPEAMKKEAAH